MQYAFKHDDVIKNTKREVAKRRKKRQGRRKTQQLDKDMQQIQDLELPLEESEYHALEKSDVNVVEHYPLYYAMLTLQSPPSDERIPILTIKDFSKLKTQLGFRKAYHNMVTKYCVNLDHPWAVIK